MDRGRLLGFSGHPGCCQQRTLLAVFYRRRRGAKQFTWCPPKGLFSSLYTDRGSHYWTIPEAGGKVDKVNLTQFGQAMKRLGIDMIAAYSPEARGQSERAFATHIKDSCRKNWRWRK